MTPKDTARMAASVHHSRFVSFMTCSSSARAAGASSAALPCLALMAVKGAWWPSRRQVRRRCVMKEGRKGVAAGPGLLRGAAGRPAARLACRDRLGRQPVAAGIPPVDGLFPGSDMEALRGQPVLVVQRAGVAFAAIAYQGSHALPAGSQCMDRTDEVGAGGHAHRPAKPGLEP